MRFTHIDSVIFEPLLERSKDGIGLILAYDIRSRGKHTVSRLTLVGLGGLRKLEKGLENFRPSIPCEDLASFPQLRVKPHKPNVPFSLC